MLNIEHRNQSVVFHVDGNDSGTSRIASLIPIVFVLSTLVLHISVLEPRFPDVAVWLLGSEVLVNLVLIIAFYRWLSSGRVSRYAVTVEHESRIISAHDKKLNQQMWEADFDHENLYLSEIRVFIGQEAYGYPALVYGEKQQDVVEASVPYPEHSVLCFGDQDRLNEVLVIFNKGGQ